MLSATVRVPSSCRAAWLRDSAVVYTVHATRKLLDRVKQPVVSVAGSPTSMLGDWYATWVGWQPQTVLVVNEATLVSVLMPLAPARSLLERFPGHLALVLRALEVPEDFVEKELAAMGDGVFARTAAWWGR